MLHGPDDPTIGRRDQAARLLLDGLELMLRVDACFQASFVLLIEQMQHFLGLMIHPTVGLDQLTMPLKMNFP